MEKYDPTIEDSYRKVMYVYMYCMLVYCQTMSEVFEVYVPYSLVYTVGVAEWILWYKPMSHQQGLCLAFVHTSIPTHSVA